MYILFHQRHQHGNQNGLNNHAGNGAGNRACPKGWQAERSNIQICTQETRKTPDYPPGYHCTKKGNIDRYTISGKYSVQISRNKAVGRQLKCHTDCHGIHNWCGKEDRPQNWCCYTNHHSPWPTTKEATQQHRQMHRTEHSSDLWNLSSQKGQYQRQCQKQRRIYKFIYFIGHSPAHFLWDISHCISQCSGILKASKYIFSKGIQFVKKRSCTCCGR